MKKVFLIYSIFCSNAFAGGTIGGGGSGLENQEILEIMSTGGAIGGNPSLVEALPKMPVSRDEFRRIRSRLSVDGVHSVPALVGSETIQVRKLQSSIVDTSITKELLPFDQSTVEGGSTGGSSGVN